MMEISSSRREIAFAAASIAVLATFIFLAAFEYPPIIDIIAYQDVRPIDALSVYADRFLTGNPRIGELALIISAGDAVARGIACLLGASIAVIGGFMLLEGRPPRFGNLYDALWIFVFIALTFLFNRNPGGVYFYTPHNANYVLGFGILLIFFGIFRIGYQRSWGGIATWALMLPLSFVAGMSNEHTPPAALGLLLLFLAWSFVYDRPRFKTWHPGAFVGLLAGFLMLLFAPGQSQRYGGQGQGVFSTPLDVLWLKIQNLWGMYTHSPLVFLAPTGLIAVAALLHRQEALRGQRAVKLTLSAALIAASLGMTFSLMYSPFHTDRVMYAANAAVALAIIAAVSALPSSFRLAQGTAGVAALGYVSWFMVTAYADVTGYRSQYEMRQALARAQIDAGCRNLVLPSYDIRHGRTLLEDGASKDPSHWLNRARARVWGADTVVIAPETVSPISSPPCR